MEQRSVQSAHRLSIQSFAPVLNRLIAYPLLAYLSARLSAARLSVCLLIRLLASFGFPSITKLMFLPFPKSYHLGKKIAHHVLKNYMSFIN